LSANLFLADPGSLDGLEPGAVVEVGGAEGHHAVSVVRLALGESVYVGDGDGTRALAEVVGVERSLLRARVVSVETEPAAAAAYTLVQALAKGDRDEQAIEAATELGVDRIVPWQAARSVVQWRAERAERGRRKWESVVVAASKQSRRFRVPQVSELARSRDVEGLLAGAALGIVLHEEARMPLARLELPADGDIVVVVGPEGGISPAELTAFETAGAVAVRLGREVLRSGSAGPAALAALNTLSRWR